MPGHADSDGFRGTPSWSIYLNRVIAAELSNLTRYYDRIIQLAPRREDSGLLMRFLIAGEKTVADDLDALPSLTQEGETRTGILLNGTLNHSLDIQGLLTGIRSRLSRTARVLIVAYNPYLAWLYRLANYLGVRRGELPSTFLTRIDLENLARLAGFAVVRVKPVGYFPWRLFGIGDLLNRLLAGMPGLRWFSLTDIILLRPIVTESEGRPSLSCIVPARNECGNIAGLMERMPDLGCDLEVIFVEGHSTDGTWEEIQRVVNEYGGRHKVLAFQQSGVGKADAVRLGFSSAGGEILTILDADLTVPPEALRQFYGAYCEGHGDFVNGSRLVYPMEEMAMPFLNRLANVFFAKTLSALLDVRIGDSLCGTKLLARHDYQRAARWWGDAGQDDPFGDFSLLFPSAVLGLGIVDVPVRYRARKYGATNIRRFWDGLMLMRMALFALSRIRLGATRGMAG